MPSTRAAQLRITSLFEDLPDTDLERIATSCAFRTHDRDAQILNESDRTDDVFFVLDGAVRINSFTPEGREVVFSDVGPGGMFGEFSAIDGRPRSASIFAISNCLLARLPADAFADLLRANPAVSLRLIELLVSKIRQMSERVFEVSALAVRERVRRELLRLATDGVPSNGGVVIEPAPTHYEFAARIGAQREAVTRELNRLEAAQLVEVHRRHIRIVDLRRLKLSPELT